MIHLVNTSVWGVLLCIQLLKYEMDSVVSLFQEQSYIFFWLLTDFFFQDGQEEPRMTFVFENTSGKVLAVDTRGKITDVEYNESLVNCRQASTAIFEFYKDMISKYALKM